MSFINKIVCLIIGHYWCNWYEPFGYDRKYRKRVCMRCNKAEVTG